MTRGGQKRPPRTQCPTTPRSQRTSTSTTPGTACAAARAAAPSPAPRRPPPCGAAPPARPRSAGCTTTRIQTRIQTTLLYLIVNHRLQRRAIKNIGMPGRASTSCCTPLYFVLDRKTVVARRRRRRRRKRRSTCARSPGGNCVNIAKRRRSWRITARTRSRSGARWCRCPSRPRLSSSSWSASICCSKSRRAPPSIPS